MGPPSERYGAVCGICNKSLPPTHSWSKIDEQMMSGNRKLYTFKGGSEHYYRRANESHRCARCFNDPSWKAREEAQKRQQVEERQRQEVARREREKTKKQSVEAMEAAKKTTEKVTALLRNKEETSSREIINQRARQVQTILPSTLASEGLCRERVEDTNTAARVLEVLCEAGSILTKQAVSVLLEQLWQQPKVFRLLSVEQLDSFKDCLGELLNDWRENLSYTPRGEVFSWIYVYLVEQYIDHNRFDLSATARGLVHDTLSLMFTSVIGCHEMVEMTSYMYQTIDREPVMENVEPMNVVEDVTVGFVHLLLTERYSEVENENVASSNWTKAACMILVNILLGEPSNSQYDFRQAMSKLVNGKIWKPMHIVSLLLSVLSLENYEGNALAEAIEQIISTQLDFTLNAGEITIADILNEEGSKALLSKVQQARILDENVEKDVESLCQEILENSWADKTVLDRAKDVLSLVFDKLPEYGYPQTLSSGGNHFLEEIRALGEMKDAYANTDFLSSTLVQLCCAVKQCEGYWPRATQILSCILLITSDQTRGRLIEISTGEGKSCIIAMFAVILALADKRVDIVTSSPVLAERDNDKWSKYYELFNLRSSHNVKITEDADRFKCYQNHIVYGTVGTFASDILRQEFHMKRIRGERDTEKSAVIVDEVDFMLLDRGVQFTYLSHHSLGFRHLDPIFSVIWTLVSRFTPMAIEGETCMHDKPQPFYKAMESVLDPDSETSVPQILEMAKMESPVGFLQNIEEGRAAEWLSTFSSDKMVEIFKTSKGLLQKGLTIYQMQEVDDRMVPKMVVAAEEDLSEDCATSILVLDKGLCLVLIKDEDNLQAGITDTIRGYTQAGKDCNINVPSHLQDFVEDRIPVWVGNAFRSLRMTKGREYLVKDGMVLPVDYKSTGVVETNKKWGDGLQQFVELKHDLQMSQVSLVTNFMSNLVYFKRYGNNLFGVSGTLGSETDQAFLREEFKVDFCHMPTYKVRKLYEDTGRVLLNEADWLSALSEEIESEMTKKPWKNARAGLIICEDMITAEKLSNELQEKVPGRIYTYTGRGKDTSTLPDKKLSPGDVIIATNLAGRGTDIKVTGEVNKAGGLFVLLTFLPSNTRIERQAFGRTGRKGLPGSSKMLINYERLPPMYKENAQSVQSLKAIRDEFEKERVVLMVKTEVLDCSVKEDLFSKYCIHLKNALKDFDHLEKDDKELAITFLHEKWGLWLQMKSDDMRGSVEKLLSSLDKMAMNAIQSIKDKESTNIYHILRFGNEHLLDGRFKEASNFYTKALNNDHKWASIALYNRAYCTLRLQGENYKAMARNDISKSLEKLNNYKEELQIILSNVHCSSFGSRDKDVEAKSDIEKHLAMRQQVLESLEKNIYEAKTILDSVKDNEDAEAVSNNIISLAQSNDEQERQELTEFWLHGLVSVFSVEKKPRFCWSALLVFFIGLAQIAAGIFLTAVSGGLLAGVGKTLVEEGVSDVYAGIKGMTTGEFDWASWGIGKAISLAITLVTFAVGALIKKGKEALKTLFTEGKKAVKETGKQLKAIPSVIKSQFGTQTLKNNFKLALKDVGKEIIQQGVGELAGLAEDKFVEALMDNLEKELLASIRSNVREAATSGKISHTVDVVSSHILGENPRGIDSQQVRRNIQDIFQKNGRYTANEYMSSHEWQSYVEELIGGVFDGLEQELKEEKKASMVIGLISKTFKTAGNIKGFADAKIQTEKLRSEFESKLNNYVIEAVLPKEDQAVPAETIVKDHKKEPKEFSDKYFRMKEEIGDDLARVLSNAIKDIWHKNYVGRVSSQINKKFNRYLSENTGKYLKRNKTDAALEAGVTALHAASMPVDLGKSTAKDVEKHKLHLLQGDEMASITDIRIVSEKLGKRIEVIDEDLNGKVMTRVGESKGDDVLTLIYQKPTKENKYGHYNAVVDGKLVIVENTGKDCMFQAVALARGGSPESVEKDSQELKRQAYQELDDNPDRWSHLIMRTNQAKAINETIMMVGGLRRTNDVSQKDLGTVMEYWKVGARDKVEADHQPPYSAIYQAVEHSPSTLLDLGKELRKLIKPNNSWTNQHLLSVITDKDEHQYLLTSRSYNESKKARKYITDAIIADDVVKMFKGTFIASCVPFVKSVDEVKQKRKDREPKDRGRDYKEQCLNVLGAWRNIFTTNAMSDKQYDEIVSWVKQQKYNSRSDSSVDELYKLCTGVIDSKAKRP